MDWGTTLVLKPIHHRHGAGGVERHHRHKAGGSIRLHLASPLAPTSCWQSKTILVTGGSAGLGKEIARAFLSEGANVVIAARGEEALRLAEVELKAAVGG